MNFQTSQKSKEELEKVVPLKDIVGATMPDAGDISQVVVFTAESGGASHMFDAQVADLRCIQQRS